ncbi:MAG TPA: hypothetical protein VIH57_04620 [Bacteroidales bacterium]
MKYDKIISYSVKINVREGVYQLKLKLIEGEEPFEVDFKSILELSAATELLRNEQNTFFDSQTKDIIIGWEPTGENDPKYLKFSKL